MRRGANPSVYGDVRSQRFPGDSENKYANKYRKEPMMAAPEPKIVLYPRPEWVVELEQKKLDWSLLDLALRTLEDPDCIKTYDRGTDAKP